MKTFPFTFHRKNNDKICRGRKNNKLTLFFPISFFLQRFNETTTAATLSSSTSASSPIQSRHSRVMHMEDKTKAFKQVVSKDELMRMQELRQPTEGYTNHQQHHQLSTRKRPLPLRRLELKSNYDLDVKLFQRIHLIDIFRCQTQSNYSYTL